MQQQYVFILEPVYGLSGNLIAWELLTRFADDTDINHEHHSARESGFFSQLSTEEKWQIFLLQLEHLEQLYRKGFQQIISVNINRDIVTSIFTDGEVQQKLELLPFFRFEISAFFIARYTRADLLILKGLAKIAPLWLDDFGPGYSNLTMMSSGIFECVKIDKAFFWKYGENHIFDILLGHLNDLCNGVIVEGVETQRHVELLANKAIYGMQGHLWNDSYLNDFIDKSWGGSGAVNLSGKQICQKKSLRSFM
ncbi:EAL domain-containing protein [Pantoea cypripedii]|uniref:Diguanylate phosphodiesterase n=1 Tax=Pantoea cypripedii TaxID=55209 RepID=A0A6B9G161_PANCY|nr:EAL domain-containing protein [Pantoea cypripedii]QGY30452.1 diguanylate phosphodiesterase [Pantoea cypripedii]